MKPSLQVSLKQQLKSTPQLQLSIKLLQLSALELNEIIKETLAANPILEIADEVSDQYSLPQETNNNDWNLALQSEDALREHLVRQMHLISSTELEFAIGVALIDAINENGRLTSSLEDIQESLGMAQKITLTEIEAVLQRLQTFDPTGIAARTLKECLIIQLHQLPATLWRDTALALVTDHLSLLADHNYSSLRKLHHLNQEQLAKVITVIHSLQPYPGLSRASLSFPQYTVPDVLVNKDLLRWQVELNSELIPKLRINLHYANLTKNLPHSDTDKCMLHNTLNDARWFLRSLENRHNTLLKVANCIVAHQLVFLEQGEAAMKPLRLEDVAQEIGLHISTVSRVINQKYMRTPRGNFALKYFFSSHLAKQDDEDCSSTAIRAFIKKMVSEEATATPLSDARLTQQLTQLGIHIARRTVAKYREMLGIPTFYERKH